MLPCPGTICRPRAAGIAQPVHLFSCEGPFTPHICLRRPPCWTHGPWGFVQSGGHCLSPREVRLGLKRKRVLPGALGLQQGEGRLPAPGGTPTFCHGLLRVLQPSPELCPSGAGLLQAEQSFGCLSSSGPPSISAAWAGWVRGAGSASAASLSCLHLRPTPLRCQGLPLRGKAMIGAFSMFNYCQLMMINLQLRASKG